jgi:serine/threonine protein kinase
MDQFERLGTLGRGAYGVAILVKRKNVRPEQKRVIKEIDLSPMTAQARCEAHTEAEVLRSLSHVNIVKLVDTFLHRDKLCIVMEFADGGDLASIVKERQDSGIFFPDAEVMATFAQCCLGLQHAHSKHILHRDIKCQNVFLTGAGTVKLGDFGIAKVLDHTTANAKTCVGTPYYAAPEVIDNRPYGLKADIWSLGVVLFQLLALKPPFHAHNLVSLVLRILSCEPRPLPETVGAEARDLVIRLLKKDSDERPTCDELLALPAVSAAAASLATQLPVRSLKFSSAVLGQEAAAASPRCAAVQVPDVQAEHKVPPKSPDMPEGLEVRSRELWNSTGLPTLPGSDLGKSAAMEITAKVTSPEPQPEAESSQLTSERGEAEPADEFKPKSQTKPASETVDTLVGLLDLGFSFPGVSTGHLSDEKTIIEGSALEGLEMTGLGELLRRSPGASDALQCNGGHETADMLRAAMGGAEVQATPSRSSKSIRRLRSDVADAAAEVAGFSFSKLAAPPPSEGDAGSSVSSTSKFSATPLRLGSRSRRRRRDRAEDMRQDGGDKKEVNRLMCSLLEKEFLNIPLQQDIVDPSTKSGELARLPLEFQQAHTDQKTQEIMSHRLAAHWDLNQQLRIDPQEAAAWGKVAGAIGRNSTNTTCNLRHVDATDSTSSIAAPMKLQTFSLGVAAANQRRRSSPPGIAPLPLVPRHALPLCKASYGPLAVPSLARRPSVENQRRFAGPAKPRSCSPAVTLTQISSTVASERPSLDSCLARAAGASLAAGPARFGSSASPSSGRGGSSNLEGRCCAAPRSVYA